MRGTHRHNQTIYTVKEAPRYGAQRRQHMSPVDRELAVKLGYSTTECLAFLNYSARGLAVSTALEWRIV